MAADIKKAKKRKRVRFREVKLKLTRNQYLSLVNYCNARRTTPTRQIKKMIRPFISNYAKIVPEELYITEKQLDLFGES